MRVLFYDYFLPFLRVARMPEDHNNTLLPHSRSRSSTADRPPKTTFHPVGSEKRRILRIWVTRQVQRNGRRKTPIGFKTGILNFPRRRHSIIGAFDQFHRKISKISAEVWQRPNAVGRRRTRFPCNDGPGVTQRRRLCVFWRNVNRRLGRPGHLPTTGLNFYTRFDARSTALKMVNKHGNPRAKFVRQYSGACGFSFGRSIKNRAGNNRTHGRRKSVIHQGSF